MIWLIAFLTKNAAIIGATAGAIQATEGAIINAVVLEKMSLGEQFGKIVLKQS